MVLNMGLNTARLLLVVWMVLGLIPSCLGPHTCLADGKVFIPGAAKVPIPDQDALIVWRDGVETLGVETRFVAPGHDFAWVVPLPSRPEVASGTTGMFPTLRALCAPDVSDHVTPYWLLFIWVSLILIIAMSMSTSWGRIALVLAGLSAVMTCVLLPSLGKARGGSVAGPAVEVLERSIIGSYDVAVISSKDPQALAAWLTENGFTMSPAAQPVIADYVAKGWVFSAAKLKRSEDTQEPSAPHPLVWTFKTEHPVYPLRLTGVESGDLKVDLYVFGPSRAEADGFEVERCASAKVAEPDPYRWGRVHDNAVELSHSGLAKLVGDGLVLTKLAATLSPTQMTRDASIRFVSGSAYLPEVVTGAAATMQAVNVGSGVFVVGVLVIALASQSVRGRAMAFKRIMALLAIACVAGGIARATASTLPTKGSFRDARSQWYAYHETGQALLGEAISRHTSGGAVDAAWARQRASELLKEYEREGRGPFREGDGPGCYSLSVSPDGEVCFTWYTEFGNECRVCASYR